MCIVLSKYPVRIFGDQKLHTKVLKTTPVIMQQVELHAVKLWNTMRFFIDVPLSDKLLHQNDLHTFHAMPQTVLTTVSEVWLRSLSRDGGRLDVHSAVTVDDSTFTRLSCLLCLHMKGLNTRLVNAARESENSAHNLELPTLNFHLCI